MLDLEIKIIKIFDSNGLRHKNHSTNLDALHQQIQMSIKLYLNRYLYILHLLEYGSCRSCYSSLRNSCTYKNVWRVIVFIGSLTRRKFGVKRNLANVSTEANRCLKANITEVICQMKENRLIFSFFIRFIFIFIVYSFFL